MRNLSMEKKMTKREWFAVLKAMVEKSEMVNKEGAVAFIDHEVSLLDKKSGSAKPTKNQVENEDFKKAIAEVLAGGKVMTATEVMVATNIPSNQRASAILKQMINEGTVVRTETKGKAYFSLAD